MDSDLFVNSKRAEGSYLCSSNGRVVKMVSLFDNGRAFAMWTSGDVDSINDFVRSDRVVNVKGQEDGWGAYAMVGDQIDIMIISQMYSGSTNQLYEDVTFRGRFETDSTFSLSRLISRGEFVTSRDLNYKCLLNKEINMSDDGWVYKKLRD